MIVSLRSSSCKDIPFLKVLRENLKDIGTGKYAISITYKYTEL